MFFCKFFFYYQFFPLTKITYCFRVFMHKDLFPESLKKFYTIEVFKMEKKTVFAKAISGKIFHPLYFMPWTTVELKMVAHIIKVYKHPIFSARGAKVLYFQLKNATTKVVSSSPYSPICIICNMVAAAAHSSTQLPYYMVQTGQLTSVGAKAYFICPVFK